MKKEALIADLAARLKKASDDYYNQLREGSAAASPISDAEYDALEAQLRALDPAHPVLAEIGAPPVGDWPEVAHGIPMGSLDKVHTIDEYLKWRGGLPAGRSVWSLKMDGISIDIVYVDGKYTWAITRGNGVTGFDITRNVGVMKGVPMTIAKMGIVYVRGEIVCLKSDFAVHFIGEATRRSTANGTAKRQSGWQKCRYLTVYSYNLTVEGAPSESRSAEFLELERLGFSTPVWGLVETDEVEALRQSYIDSKRDALDYEVDGIVLELNDTAVREAQGVSGMCPKGAVAFKFPAEMMKTVLRDIIWNLGNSGIVTPIAVYDTLDFNGFQTSRAKLHTVGVIRRICEFEGADVLREGDFILVSKRGDVIPQVEKRLPGNALSLAGLPAPELLPPANCPHCDTDLEMDGQHLVCPGEECPAQVVGDLIRWVSKLGILHLGGTQIRALVEEGKVNTIDDLYRLSEQDYADTLVNGRRLGGNARRIMASLEPTRTLPVDLFVGSLGIPLCGRKTVSYLVDAGYDTLSKLASVTVDEMCAVEGFGRGRAQAFREGFDSRKGLMMLIISAGVKVVVPEARPEPTGTAMAGQVICMTGFRDTKPGTPAYGMTDAILAAGGQVSGFSGKTTLLVIANHSVSNNKTKKAAAAGTETLDIEEMWVRLGGRPSS